ncbi:MAG: TetR/AcrR family transcriptional regulator [Bryobacteraceae bacterium]
MTTKTPSKAEQTRERILAAALTLFRERGFEETTMREIAAEAGMAVGAAYYYFESKEALVLSFYERAASDRRDLADEALAAHETLEARVAAVLDITLRYFEPNRKFLGALLRHAGDPKHPLSPFSQETRELREQNIGQFAQAIEGSDVKAPSDLAPHLPRLLWLYQMGLILFWLYDHSPNQTRTAQLMAQSLPLVVTLIKLAKNPLLRPVRKRVLGLLETVYAD